MKDILVVTNFCRDLSEKDNGRFLYLCRELYKTNNIELVTSNYCHQEKKHRKNCVNDLPFKITFIEEPGYKKNISLKRFFSHFIWGMNLKRYLKKRKKPDVIYCAVPSLTGPLMVAEFCKKNKIRFIIDIQDLWPEAFKMVFNLPIVSNMIYAPFYYIANMIYKQADSIVAVSDSYVERALSVNKKCKNGNTVYLGTKLETYDKNVKTTEPLYKKSDDKTWIGYCGSLAASYDIPNLLSATDMLTKKGHNVKLIIMGDGTHRQYFENISNKLNSDIVFTGRLQYDQMCVQLNECDIVVNPIKHGSAASIINKHADYAASGLPVVNTQENKEYRNLIEKYCMGFNCVNEDAYDMADKIEKLILDKEMRLKMGENARKCAQERFDRKVTYKKIIDLIEM